MWPFTHRESSPVASPEGICAVDCAYHLFIDNATSLKVNFSREMWAQVTEIAHRKDCSMNSVVLALLFEEMYGKRAYLGLLDYAEQLKRQERSLAAQVEGERIRFSRDRASSIDVRHMGPADTPRAVSMPDRMSVDLRRLALKNGVEASAYLRELLFKVLNGSVKHQSWKTERAVIAGTGDQTERS